MSAQSVFSLVPINVDKVKESKSKLFIHWKSKMIEILKIGDFVSLLYFVKQRVFFDSSSLSLEVFTGFEMLSDQDPSLLQRDPAFKSADNHREDCHRFWLRLHDTVILISNVRISTSVKINWIVLISILMVLTTMFERTEEKFYGFRQTDFRKWTLRKWDTENF